MASPSLLFRIDAALCLSCNRTSRNRLVRWAFRRISRLGAVREGAPLTVLDRHFRS
jgi:hypothetical protein